MEGREVALGSSEILLKPRMEDEAEAEYDFVYFVCYCSVVYNCE